MTKQQEPTGQKPAQAPTQGQKPVRTDQNREAKGGANGTGGVGGTGGSSL